MQIQPYLFFNGRCEEALNYYREVLGAQIGDLMRFKDSPVPTQAPPNSDDKIMHASFRIGDSEIMASDGCDEVAQFSGFSLSVSAANSVEAERLFNGLANGGQVRMPLAATFYSPCFGMVTDRFGVGWMVIVP